MIQPCHAEPCKRPARWSVQFWNGTPSMHTPGRNWCKVHAEEEVARLKAEMPDAERKHRIDVIAQRNGTIYNIVKVGYAVYEAAQRIERLAEGTEDGGWKRITPDPMFATYLRAAIACFGDMALLSSITDTLYELAKRDFPPPPAPPEKEEALP